MSLAENLLNDLPETEQNIEKLSAEEPHIIVGADRRITVPQELKEIAVTGDKNIETVTFDCVRYWDGNDLSTFAIYLNYTLPDGTEETYIPTSIYRSDEYYTFDWTLDSNMTEIEGNLKISIVAVLTDESGNKTKQWGSYPNSDLTIVKGLDIANVPDVAEHPDLLSQILSELNEKVSVEEMENYESSIVKKGEAENSAVLDGEYQGYSNDAISQASLALGAANVGGLKGWYYKYVDYTNKQIYLSATQPTIQNILKPSADSSFESGYDVGDLISFVSGSSFENTSKITAINGNEITVDFLPFTSTPVTSVGSPLEYSLYCVEKYNVGGCDLGQGAFAEGVLTRANNVGAHSEGIKTVSYGQASHTEGFETEAGNSAHAEGRNTKAHAQSSHAEGYSTESTGVSSHAEGEGTKSEGQASHAEGVNTEAKQIGTHAEGGLTVAEKEWSHAEGYNTRADAVCGHAEGNGTNARGTNSHAEGNATVASGEASHAEGTGTVATMANAHSEGKSTQAVGNSSHAEGFGSSSIGFGSHAEGGQTKATREWSHAEGYNTIADEVCAHAEGNGTVAKGTNSHAEGTSTEANQVGSHAEGGLTKANKEWSHAEGYSTTADGVCAHAEGNGTSALSENSHAEGMRTTAMGEAQHVQGKYNVADARFAHIVGNGTEGNPSNCHVLDWDGNAWFSGGIVLNSPNGTRYRITVTDNGELSVSPFEFA